MATYGDFQAQLRAQLEEPSPGIWQDSSLLYWTNEGAKDIARKTRIMRDEQYTTAQIGQNSYELPEYTLEPVAVYYDDTMLTREDFSDWYSLTSYGERGTPVAYAVTDDALHLRPAPDAELEIRYFRYRTPDEITDTTDDMPFKSDYNTAIEYYVLQRAFSQVNDWQSSGEFAARYAEAVDAIAVQEGMEQQAIKNKSPREVY